MTSAHNLSISPTNIGIINSLSLNKQDIMFYIYAKVYTANQKSKRFIESGLEGCLCLTYNLESLNFHFLLYDLSTYEVLFDACLYENFINGYTKSNSQFHFFEICDGFVGFLFNDPLASESLFEILSSKITSDQSLKLSKDYCVFTEKIIEDYGKKGINLLKKRLTAQYKINSTNELQINPSLENKIILDQDKLNEVISHFYYNDETEKIVFVGNYDHLYEFLNEANLNRILDRDLFEFIDAHELHINNTEKYIELMALHLLKDYETNNKIKKMKRQIKSDITTRKGSSIRGSAQRATFHQKTGNAFANVFSLINLSSSYGKGNSSNPQRATIIKPSVKVTQSTNFIIQEEPELQITSCKRFEDDQTYNNRATNHRLTEFNRNDGNNIKSDTLTYKGITEVPNNMTIQEILPTDIKKKNVLGQTERNFDYSRLDRQTVCNKMEDKSFRHLLKKVPKQEP